MNQTLAVLVNEWWQHVAIVAAYAVVLFGTLAWVRRRRSGVARRRFIVGSAVAAALASIAVNAWWFQPARFDWHKSLPLYLCDLVGIIAPIALLTSARWPRALLHFWGIGLCSQWMCTPVANAGPQRAEFWVSFALHASILGSAACDVIVRGYRPGWRELRLAIAAGVLYAAVVLPLDIAMGANYGYLGDTRPDAPTIVDVLGPWPLRILWISLLSAGAMTLVQCAWAVLRRVRPEWAVAGESAVK